MRKCPQIVLAVGPSVTLARRALSVHGLDPAGLDGLRLITRAHCLRGWSSGTPVAAVDVETWPHFGEAGRELADCLLALVAAGRLRLLQDADVEAFRRAAA